jgi:hypothetical protein
VLRRVKIVDAYSPFDRTDGVTVTGGEALHAAGLKFKGRLPARTLWRCISTIGTESTNVIYFHVASRSGNDETRVSGGARGH